MNGPSLGRGTKAKGSIKKQSHAATWTIACKMILLSFILMNELILSDEDKAIILF
jgi:hypothetical protein